MIVASSANKQVMLQRRLRKSQQYNDEGPMTAPRNKNFKLEPMPFGAPNALLQERPRRHDILLSQPRAEKPDRKNKDT